jgi:ATP-dependent Zn protease
MFNGRRTKLAYHEAGHAVIARVLGVEVTGVTMLPTDGTAARVITTSVAMQHRGLDDFVAGMVIDSKIALARPITQWQYKRTEDVRGWDDDIERASNYIAAAVLAEREGKIPQLGAFELDTIERARAEEMFNKARTETEALVQASWQAIERVAAALQTRDLLTQRDLDDLIANA